MLIGVTGSYWRLKNSWGSRWGENGFIRVKLGNFCGICERPSFGFLLWFDSFLITFGSQDLFFCVLSLTNKIEKLIESVESVKRLRENILFCDLEGVFLLDLLLDRTNGTFNMGFVILFYQEIVTNFGKLLDCQLFSFIKFRF